MIGLLNPAPLFAQGDASAPVATSPEPAPATDVPSDDVPTAAVSNTEASNAGPNKAETATPFAAAWWRRTRDPILEYLVDRALAGDHAISCRVDRLYMQDIAQASHERQLTTRISRLFGNRDEETPLMRDRRVDIIAQRRLDLTRRVAQAYLDVRRLQQREALRADLLEQFKDNAEIARFRRQAGLVPAVDEAMAQSQEIALNAELGSDRSVLEAALASLALLVGETPESLRARFFDGSAVWPPELGLPTPPTTQGASDPAAEATDATQPASLERAAQSAKRTVRDARNAYREGVGSFAALYVAEAAAASIGQAQADQVARSLAAAIDIRAKEDTAWAREGLDSITVAGRTSEPQASEVVVDCD